MSFLEPFRRIHDDSAGMMSIVPRICASNMRMVIVRCGRGNASNEKEPVNDVTNAVNFA